MSTPSDAPTSSQISLTDLTLEQLHQVRQQLDQELQHLTNAFQELRLAQVKFAAALESLDSLKKANQDKNILIPLTSSLYVPGKIKDPEHVLVDIGTGYYVEKTTKQAKTYYNQKNLTLRSSLATLQSQIEKKEDNMRAAMSVYNQKVAREGGARAARADGGEDR
ncbi:BZ3500_MvSof-1268-A1-R1_Chr1-1g01217 [Microbotryum saponariae]|uniref:BZ3500_MvSof-1268-A1-R1_Chr1-1g01217 protein n=1 Tax=Microbotryum saponariae TaxID=289078 RepID=A0A2X0ME49_9BASI|nr:BZ3500_MvSof-1268-A1-R1_Chr1-1g01217 [Microbotryum saponariae]